MECDSVLDVSAAGDTGTPASRMKRSFKSADFFDWIAAIGEYKIVINRPQELDQELP